MVPRKIGHIWIGPHAAPTDWMQTWITAHPTWSYTLFDNAFLTGRRFRNQALINEYMRRGKFAGVSDLMRYEILYEQGGFLPEADSVCLHPVDDLLTEDRVYSVYEFPEGRTGMMSPFLASNAGNALVKKVIDTLGTTYTPETMNDPWHSTGNGFLRRFFAANKALKADITVFPSHYFIPEHYKGEVYTGTDLLYARQMWATTNRSYAHSRGKSPMTAEEIAAARAALEQQLDHNLAHLPVVVD